MLLKGKIALVTGVANDRSIAYAIAKQYREQGAIVILSYQGEKLKERVQSIAQDLGIEHIFEVDATDQTQVKNMFEEINKKYNGLDIIIHSIAFARKEELQGGISESSEEGFLLAQQISAYTLISLARYGAPLMEKRGGGSISALTYIGSTRAMPNYNAMGVAKASLEAIVRYLALELGHKNIRVNSISPGPINTLAARGITGFKDMYKGALDSQLIKRNISPEDVAGTAVFLASDLSTMVTGMIIFVDGGFHCGTSFNLEP
ncbi:Enoyl-[acyl-carrier-protein] reductase [NADH] [Brevinema andersonii]|uniref:Enoyl-[acyl-carrier-protein] reductase [NADH] n=1 Tax=Brevinema andersonii TaxID=34097 RepID=A0A1I1EQ93_BREAD|nr:enoyl-ACP reductase [Brevinema andersonii]SFB87678.1 Enoyl-[acyl-carrier-protein] reductase [NADH] [Brevinema andersonii]